MKSLSCTVLNYDLSDLTISNQHNQTSLTGKVLVYIVGSSSNHCNFTEQGERNAVEPSDEAVDLLVAAWFLLSKLVAREGQYIEVERSKVSLELLQIFIVLLSEATFTRYIHNQGHLKHANEHKCLTVPMTKAAKIHEKPDDSELHSLGEIQNKLVC